MFYHCSFLVLAVRLKIGHLVNRVTLDFNPRSITAPPQP